MFEEKEKEPLLSDELKDIINRSIGEKIESNSDDIIRCKYKIMNMLVADQDLLHALHNENLGGNKDIINGDAYRDVCIFDYFRLPENKAEVKNYVCFEVSDISSYNSMINRRIIFRVVAHKDDQKTDYGVSRDTLLALIIKNKFNWSNALGMHLEKDSDVPNVTNNGYCYREIVYKVKSPNDTYNKLNNR